MASIDYQPAIAGIIDLWDDILFVQGKGVTARKLKPYALAAFKEPGSFLHRLIDQFPSQANWFSSYRNKPINTRRKLVGQALPIKTIQELSWILKHGIYFTAIYYRSEGIGAAEAERNLETLFNDALVAIDLKELTTVDNNIVYDNPIHTAMTRLKLSPGNIAGADKRLKYLLYRYLKRLTGDLTLYEQDLKYTLWECANGNQHFQDEILRFIVSDPPIPLAKQISLFMRIFKGQEKGGTRITLIRMLRKTIADLPDIKDEIREMRRRESVPDFALVRDDEILQSIPSSIHSPSKNKIDNLLQKLKPRELEIISSEAARIEADKNRSEWYGGSANAEKVKQKMKYIRSKYRKYR